MAGAADAGVDDGGATGTVAPKDADVMGTMAPMDMMVLRDMMDMTAPTGVDAMA